VQQFVRISRSRFGCAFQSGLEDTRASVSESSSCMSLTAVVLLVISAVCFENHCEPNSLIQGGTEKSATYKLHANILPSCGFISVDTWLRSTESTDLIFITIRDVKTVYISEPVCRNRFFTGYRKAYCERDNCHRLLRACYQSITCCFTAAVACIPDARTPSQRNKGQWRMKAVGGRGNRCYAAVS